ncbi:MAG: phosphoribosylaminoimidazolesuccinocarboxamide synthase [Chloroflexi bacterium]|nr:phosphoribosylaminoimidazolesuccinocarboxamide synthase [Chloroflexota bacterium]
MAVITETKLPNLYYRGKVRDTYNLGNELLIIATDRLSAFDVVLPTGIPEKGVVLNHLSAFWFEKTAHIVPNHLIALASDAPKASKDKNAAFISSLPRDLALRGMLVKKAKRVDIECVVRGYLSGSAWAEYSKEGTINGTPMPKGLRESDKLPEVMFTPTTKAETGHDQNMSMAEVRKMVGASLTRELEEKSLAIYRFADSYARTRGIIIADTKMEFGILDGKVILIDELLTPDSSRFWDAEKYTPGRPQPSYDKQFVRDWLVKSGWNKEPPAPALPTDVVIGTAERYKEAYRRLTGMAL